MGGGAFTSALLSGARAVTSPPALWLARPEQSGGHGRPGGGFLCPHRCLTGALLCVQGRPGDLGPIGYQGMKVCLCLLSEWSALPGAQTLLGSSQGTGPQDTSDTPSLLCLLCREKKGAEGRR